MERTSNIRTDSQAGPRTEHNVKNLERRATHNAVEKMRRDALHARFLTLASLLPPLNKPRRRTKAAIVNATIMTLKAARRHRVLVVETLRTVTTEAEQLRKEVNRWRTQALLPQLAAPARSDKHLAVLNNEVMDCEYIFNGEEGHGVEDAGHEDGEEGLSDGENGEADSDAVFLQVVSSPVSSPQRHGSTTQRPYITPAIAASSNVWWDDAEGPPMELVHHDSPTSKWEIGIVADSLLPRNSGGYCVSPGLYNDGHVFDPSSEEDANPTNIRASRGIRGSPVAREPVWDTHQSVWARLRDLNEWFRRLALSKHLWLSLVVDLSSRYFISNGLAIHDCTTSQLIAKVKYLPKHGLGVPLCRRLFPSRRLFLSRQMVNSFQAVWTLTLKSVFTYWAIEMLHYGHTAIFVFHDCLPKHEFSIVKVDLTTGISDELSHLEFNAPAGSLYSPTISGDFLGLGLTTQYNRMAVVVNWRKREYVVLASKDSDSSQNNYIEFVRGHIILLAVAHEPPHELRIVAHPLRSFSSRWRSLDEFTDLPPPEIRIDPEDTPPIMVERLEHNNRMFTVSPSRGCFRVVMTLYANPIRDDAYKLMTYVSPIGRNQGNHSFGGKVGRPVLFNYALNVGADNFSWKKISAFAIVPDLNFPLSYAGYAVVSTFHDSFRTATRIVHPRLTDRFLTKWTGQAIREVMVVSKQSAAVCLSPSGVVLVSKRDQVEVSSWI
ncbi:hypothetical protein C8R45DRAFT_1149280 [Mycena sanguinolenta]|nr:hypothetical protein C8R45DRAFT_1149280 [Mycena sanguinolenta]